MHKADRLGHRQTPERHKQVAATQRAQHRLALNAAAQTVGPYASGIYHGFGFCRVAVAGKSIHHAQATDSALRYLQITGGGVIQGYRTLFLRLGQHAPYQACIVCFGIAKHHCTLQVGRCQARCQ